MSTTEIRKRLHNYIERAEDKKIKAIYTMVEEDIELRGKWNDKDFIAEIDRRTKDLESGKVKGLSLGEVKTRITKSLKTSRAR